MTIDDLSRRIEIRAADTVEMSIAALAAGRMVIVTDDADRENEGDIVLAANTATTEQIAFMVRHTSGIICSPMPADRADALSLPYMVANNTDPHSTAFTVSVDHRDSGTGVSASDRAYTLRALANPSTQPIELRRPGHIFPLRACEGGVLVRPGHTEATVDLLRLAGQPPIGVIGEIVDIDGSMARGARLRTFAVEHGLPILAIADLVRYRRSNRLIQPADLLRFGQGPCQVLIDRNVRDFVCDAGQDVA